ncbi:bifunctional adenosylcobinamide kinase/adenosylcobinamide-phosphate guanylyltransferase [Desertibacillus haloalkaliphilus]|uniref:bifunctional adenosylcobinamide kinase/adenosylcobinamide-phosphate guanylyltransferase n=1 Tax=Desertibacillus haloalkaliphilus TaxID=1328930 RepID=UPI001C25F531|nr:bifunctional adenosylcobinamide kinase/adenosylcobinamide-phosphate guanylyltransferase [Desertibacillus haloalkaliphilus]MBU8907185.1 bifunctional adenosylcobinamide kinase/adenosylcobinamide-phosphate guanylyltransferase [Desertibacillus haloalkaliphilus]
MMIFVTGGVRSGKSHFAEQLVQKCAKSNSTLHYIATSICVDQEMEERVQRHQDERMKQTQRWLTSEASRHIESCFSKIDEKDVVLLDCLTNLVSNELFYGWQEGDEKWKDEDYRNRLFERLAMTLTILKKKANTTVIVSNELFQGELPTDPGTLYYLHFLGNLHQFVVHLSDTAMLVEAGIPIIKKQGGMKV